MRNRRKQDSPIYEVWRNMIKRTTNRNLKSFKNYGERGISVCERWKESFWNFEEDMIGSFKGGLSIDRKDNNGNYEPLNCRWTTKNIQSRNVQKIRSNNTSGIKGVYYNKKDKLWVSKIVVNGKAIYLGCFKSIEDARETYDNYIIENDLEHTKNIEAKELDGLAK